MFATTIDGIKRVIEWTELNQLKKDILWIFDENTGQLNASFVPDDSLKSKYWEYLTLVDEKEVSPGDIHFYIEGVLIIILCMTIEYNDTTTGNKKVFGDTRVKDIKGLVEAFIPSNQNQEKLKTLVLLGLSIADSMTPMDLLDTDGYDHKDLKKFYSQLNWVDTTFIKPYFISLIR